MHDVTRNDPSFAVVRVYEQVSRVVDVVGESLPLLAPLLDAHPLTSGDERLAVLLREQRATPGRVQEISSRTQLRQHREKKVVEGRSLTP